MWRAVRAARCVRGVVGGVSPTSRGDGVGLVGAVVIVAGVGGRDGWWLRPAGVSGGDGPRANAGERFGDRAVRGRAGGKVQRPATGGPSQPAGQREQPPAQGASGADGLAGQAEHRSPAQQVVGDAGDYRPGGVGVELAGGKVRERLVFEVADAELDDGVLAVLGFDDSERLGAVGGERKQLPGGQQLALGVEGAYAANDQPAAVEGGLCDLRDARGRVVLKRRPGVLVDLLDRGANGGLETNADRELPAGAVQAIKRRARPEARVGAQQLWAPRAGALDAGDELIAEAQHPARGVRRPLPQADVQDLAGVRPDGHQRVIAADAGVAERGALLAAPVDLADEGVDVDHQALDARTGACPPGARERIAQDPVKLADVPERKRPQKRPERRRRRDLVAEDLPGPPGAQDVAVIDAVRAQ